MLNGNLIIALKKAGFEVTGGGEEKPRDFFAKGHGGCFARWYIRGYDQFCTEKKDAEAVDHVYISSEQAEADWVGQQDGCAGSFYDSITDVIAALQRFTYKRYLNGASVVVQCSASAKGRKVTLKCDLFVSRNKTTPKTAQMYHTVTVEDMEGIQFLRGKPVDSILADWIEDRDGEAAAILGRSNPDMAPRPVIEVRAVRYSRAFVARLLMGDEVKWMVEIKDSPMAARAMEVIAGREVVYLEQESPDYKVFAALK